MTHFFTHAHRRQQSEATEKKNVCEDTQSQPPDTAESKPPVMRVAALSGCERGGERQRIAHSSLQPSDVRFGGVVKQTSSTQTLVEVLVSKNRKLATYKKMIKDLKQRVKELEQTNK